VAASSGMRDLTKAEGAALGVDTALAGFLYVIMSFIGSMGFASRKG
jgi:hypothetical protein